MLACRVSNSTNSSSRSYFQFRQFLLGKVVSAFHFSFNRDAVPVSDFLASSGKGKENH